MMTDRRYIFMGTPAFAATILDHLVDKGFAPTLVITQPDKPVGRKAILTPSDVKRRAKAHRIEVLTPSRLMDDELLQKVREKKPDVVVTAAFGKIVPLAFLALPDYGCLNVHTSLLPKYRGASPVSAAILAGDKKTGVTIMQMDQGLDTGPLLSQKSVAIEAQDTTKSLTEKLALVAGPLLYKTLEALFAGKLVEQPQDEAEASMTHLLSKKDGALDFSKPAHFLERHVRAMQPWPVAHAFLGDKKISVLRAAVLEGDVLQAPGAIVGLHSGIDIACGQDVLRLLDIVPAGSRPMAAEALAHNLTLGDRFLVAT